LIPTVGNLRLKWRLPYSVVALAAASLGAAYLAAISDVSRKIVECGLSSGIIAPFPCGSA
jgi:hypothetical protein